MIPSCWDFRFRDFEGNKSGSRDGGMLGEVGVAGTCQLTGNGTQLQPEEKSSHYCIFQLFKGTVRTKIFSLSHAVLCCFLSSIMEQDGTCGAQNSTEASPSRNHDLVSWRNQTANYVMVPLYKLTNPPIFPISLLFFFPGV